jgi:hypothetical protein
MMKGPDESLVVSALQELLAPLAALEETLNARELELRAELAVVRSERSRLRQILRATHEPVKKPAKGPRERGAPRAAPYAVSEQLVAQVAAAVATEGGEFSVKTVSERTGIDHDSTRKALARLRERDAIRLVGVRGKGGAAFYVTTPKGRELNGDSP